MNPAAPIYVFPVRFYCVAYAVKAVQKDLSIQRSWNSMRLNMRRDYENRIIHSKMVVVGR